MSPRTGRPLSENPKDIRVETRMTQEELKKLDFCCKFTGKSRSEIIRNGVDKVYTECKDHEEK